MHRFFAVSGEIGNGKITLSGGNYKHLVVLRLSKNELFCVCDAHGTDFICRIAELGKDAAVCDIVESRASEGEPKCKITLYQGLPKADKMEHIIQKCVELGVYRIVPVITRNCVVRLNDGNNHKTERYNKISEAAARQCGRGIIPQVSETISFDTAVKELSLMDDAYMAYENEKELKITSAFESELCMNRVGDEVGFFVGPEGGFDDREVTKCAESKICVVSLGRRILRTETAGFMMLISYLYSKGEL